MELRDYITTLLIALLIMCTINIAITLIFDSCNVNLPGWCTFSIDTVKNWLIVMWIYHKIKGK
jgi:hypothetical protein